MILANGTITNTSPTTPIVFADDLSSWALIFDLLYVDVDFGSTVKFFEISSAICSASEEFSTFDTALNTSEHRESALLGEIISWMVDVTNVREVWVTIKFEDTIVVRVAVNVSVTVNADWPPINGNGGIDIVTVANAVVVTSTVSVVVKLLQDKIAEEGKRKLLDFRVVLGDGKTDVGLMTRKNI